VPCLGAAAVLHAGRTPDAFASRLLSTRPFVFLGLISYSLYLWHVPIITFYELEVVKHTSYLAKAGLFGASVVVAYLSWKFVEQPVRKKTFISERRHVFALGGASAVLATLVALVIVQGGGLKERFRPDVQKLAAFDYAPAKAMRLGTCFLSREAARFSEYDDKTCLAVSAEKKNILILGDSYAAHLWAGLTAAYPNVNFLQATASGCATDLSGSGSDRCHEVMDAVFQQFLPHNKIDGAIVATNWTGRETPKIMRVIERLKPFVKDVYVFGPLVHYNSPLPRLLALSVLRKDPDLVTRSRYKKDFKTDRAFRAWFADKGVHYVSLIAALCDGESHCATVDQEQRPLQFDGGHMTSFGSEYLARRLRQQLAFAHEAHAPITDRLAGNAAPAAP
jgi:hypothetical protein